jgi:hypothetical protein
MTNNIKILSLLLFIQVTLVAIFYNKKSTTAQFEPSTALLTLNTETLDKISIEDADKKNLELTQKNGNWSIPSKDNFPVSSNKIKDFLNKIKNFKQSWPTGQTMIAAKQFSVVEDKFERKISFTNKDNKQTKLYLGSSPGFKKVNARVDNETNTYKIEYNTYDVSSDPKDWFDKKHFSLKRGEISTVTINDIVLSRKDEGLVLTELKVSEKQNHEKVNKILEKIENLSFQDIVDKEHKRGKTILTWNIELIKGNQLSYKVTDWSPTKDDKNKDNLVMSSSNSPYLAKVTRTQIEELLDLKRSDLIEASNLAKKESDKEESNK